MKLLRFHQKVVAILWLLISLIATQVACADTSPQPRLLNVRGEAQLQVSPDQAVVILGVVSEAKTAKKALADNSEAMNAVVGALQKLGLDKKAIATQRLGVQPVWSIRPRNADSQWRSEIMGYRVNNTVSVTTTKLDLLGDLVSTAITAGANDVQSIQFGLTDPRQYRSQAIEQAVNNARADADTAAAAAGARIKRIHVIHVDQSVASRQRVEKAVLMRAVAADAASEPPPINAGDIAVAASVSISYELE